MSELAAIVTALGSLGVFLVGYRQITGATMRWMGPRFRIAAERLSSRRVGRLLAGVMVAAGGSSTSGTVALVSMVDSGAVTFDRTPWVFAGINLGAGLACLVVAIVGFHAPLASAALIVMAAAVPFRLSSTLRRYAHGEALAGLALMMLAIDLMTGRLIAQSAESVPRFFEIAAGYRLVPLSGIVIGLAVSAVVRSPVGTTVFAMSLAVRGWLPGDAAAAVSLGAILGLPTVAFSASRTLGAAARRASVVQAAVALSACIVGAVVLLTAAAETLTAAGSPARTVAAIAAFITGVHLIVIALVPATERMIVALAARLHPDADEPSAQPGAMSLLSPTLPESLEANLERSQSALARMAAMAYEMLMVVINCSQVDDRIEQETERIAAMRQAIRNAEDEVLSALTRYVQLPCTRVQAERIQQQQRIARELAFIGDDCYKTARLLARSYRKQYRFHDQGRDELFDFTSQILDFLKYNSDYLNGLIDRPDRDLARSMEQTIDKVRDRLKKRSRKVLEKRPDADIRGELAFIDIVSHLEHVGDRCLGIAETVHRLTTGSDESGESES